MGDNLFLRERPRTWILSREVQLSLFRIETQENRLPGSTPVLSEKEPFSIVVRHYAAAVAVHAVFNASVLINPIYGFLVALIVAISGIEFTRRRIIDLDLRAGDVAYREQLLHQPSRDDWWKHSGDKWRERTNSWENKKYRV